MEDILLRVDWYRLLRFARHHWSEAILIESEAPVQSPGPHGFVEAVTAGEVENPAVELVVRDQPDVQPSGGQV